MRGEVEVWSGDDLILKEANMLTDGAGELLAEIMTISPSLSGIDDLATSSITDASNYTIQAISFGTGSEAFQTQGRDLYQKKLTQLSVIALSQRGGLINNAFIKTVDATAGSFFPNTGFSVESPNPVSKVLSENSNVSSVLPITDGSSITEYALSSYFPGNGQHMNFAPSAIRNHVTAGTVFDVSAELVGGLLGSYPAGISEEGTTSVGILYYKNLDGSIASSVTLSAGSYPNEASSMDTKGFINMIMSSVPTTGYSMSSAASGLTLSASSDFSSNGTIEYSTKLSKDDLVCLNAFGGIFKMGLWTIDMNESLLAGNTPPFAFSVLDNPRKYRLFCRKGISRDLTYISDVTKYEDLTIKWRLHFL